MGSVGASLASLASLAVLATLAVRASRAHEPPSKREPPRFARRLTRAFVSGMHDYLLHVQKRYDMVLLWLLTSLFFLQK